MTSKIICCVVFLLTGLVPAHSQDAATRSIDTFIVQFKPSYPIRLRKNGLAPEWYFNKSFLPRGDTSGVLAQQGLDEFTTTLSASGISNASKLFPGDDSTYDQDRINAEKRMPQLIQQKAIGQYTPIPDLNRFYLVIIRYKPGLGRKEFLDSLAHDEAVDTAYPLYHSIDAAFPLSRPIPDSHRKTVGRPAAQLDPDFTRRQKYLYAQPTGINAPSAWSFPGGGGKGDAVKLIDIEFNWDFQHADLKQNWLLIGDCDENANSCDFGHGTAVLGELIGVHNNFGVNGICPNISYGSISVSPANILSAAIAEAADTLHPGDIILIEQELKPDSFSTGKTACGNSQYGVLPAESAPDCYHAITVATIKGIIVVEAAGNGELNLDDPRYHGRFDPQRTPGAIMVSADTGGNGVPACCTNYGSRVNYYAWGAHVVTTGGDGDLTPFTSDRDHFYTDTFNGTSSASPIIAGVIADIQGIRLRRGLSLWNAGELLQHIKGSPQAPGTFNKPIGIFPDLSATLRKML